MSIEGFISKLQSRLEKIEMARKRSSGARAKKLADEKRAIEDALCKASSSGIVSDTVML